MLGASGVGKTSVVDHYRNVQPVEKQWKEAQYYDSALCLSYGLARNNEAWIHYAHGRPASGKLTRPGTWYAWVINCPATAEYVIRAETEAGGEFEIKADGKALGDTMESGKLDQAVRTVKLTKGVHGIRIRNRGGSFALSRIAVGPVQRQTEGKPE